jgi:hypothetical protein
MVEADREVHTAHRREDAGHDDRPIADAVDVDAYRVGCTGVLAARSGFEGRAAVGR